MEGNRHRVGLLALFAPDTDLAPLRRRLNEAGIRDERISLLSSIPVTEGRGAELEPFWPYAITMAAGLVGIGIGLFFAAGTAAMYPLMTGGKPIVSAPVVGIISFETMMLLAIMTTFVTMMVRIKRAHHRTVDRDAGIDDGKLALSVQSIQAGQEATVSRLLEAAGAETIRLVFQDDSPDGRLPAGALAVLILLCTTAACSQDMQDQPSYRSQEAPRLHSPAGSIPRDSRTLVLSHDEARPDLAGELYRINCLPCHGKNGKGTGPVAGYLKELPADLLAPQVQALSTEQLYGIITNGKGMMPPFRGELSATERLAIASFIRSMGPVLTTTPP